MRRHEGIAEYSDEDEIHLENKHTHTCNQHGIAESILRWVTAFFKVWVTSKKKQLLRNLNAGYIRKQHTNHLWFLYFKSHQCSLDISHMVPYIHNTLTYLLKLLFLNHSPKRKINLKNIYFIQMLKYEQEESHFYLEKQLL